MEAGRFLPDVYDMEVMGHDLNIYSAEELTPCKEAAWSSPRGELKNQEPVLQITGCQPPSRASGISSEDSAEEWQQCREAAVSANAILKESAIHSLDHGEKEVKKKKKKAWKAVSIDPAEATTPASGAVAQKQEKELSVIRGDQVSPGTKKKKRKKKAEANKASSCPLAKCAATVLAN
ncbi:hypothetical protein GW7_10246 [Heterocephalus glaber]|uniref:Protein CUSTOS n=1 Tax=Heterocephalus glaber TaxID=10181 RepID=G5AU81_HETGA|nr:hypothetical protein GW7_10246 [Heterocephalus glaber]